MNLSYEYSLVRSTRTAVLNGDVILRLLDKYPTAGKVGVVDVRWLNNYFGGYGNKSDLITEWVLKNIASNQARMDDVVRFNDAARFYFDNQASPKFKKTVADMIEDYNEMGQTLTISPKNILDFNLWEMEELEERFHKVEVDPRVNELEEKLPEGAKIFYNDGIYQVVEVTSAQAACQLSRGTKWCTSDEDVSGEYLEYGPLYVIYIRGKKTAQVHIGDDLQIMDLRDRPLKVDDNLRDLLLRSGLMGQIFASENSWQYDLAELMGTTPSKQLEQLALLSPSSSEWYANQVLHGRFPAGEDSIMFSGFFSFEYAELINGRFKAGEAKISQDESLARQYYNFLRSLGRGEEKEFLRDWPMALTE